MFADSGSVVRVQGTKERGVLKRVSLPVLIQPRWRELGMDEAGLDSSVQGADVKRKHVTHQSSEMVKVLGRQGAHSLLVGPLTAPRSMWILRDSARAS